VCNFQGT